MAQSGGKLAHSRAGRQASAPVACAPPARGPRPAAIAGYSVRRSEAARSSAPPPRRGARPTGKQTPAAMLEAAFGTSGQSRKTQRYNALEASVRAVFFVGSMVGDSM